MATNQFLTFTLADEQYGVEVVQVREILSEIPLTVIPRMPDYMKGVIDIRDSVVPVVDLRTKFGLPETESTVDTSIIVMDIRTGEGSITVGCLADSVQEVVDIAEETIEPPPTIGTAVDARFIRGLGQRNERFVIILDVDRVFHDEAEDFASVADVPLTSAASTN